MDMKIKNGVAIVNIADRQVSFEEADLTLTTCGYARTGEWAVVMRKQELRAEVVRID